MAEVTLGVFGGKREAEEAIANLEEAGFNPKEISVIARDTAIGDEVANSTGSNVVTGATTGITAGGLVGGIAGLLVGIGAIAIPGIGALLIGGPIAAALGLSGAAATTVSGAVTGAVAGGLMGALTGLGVPQEEAVKYEERVKGGGIIVAVPSAHDSRESREILSKNGADMIRNVHVDNYSSA